jgi:sodium/hydrogen antiporter
LQCPHLSGGSAPSAPIGTLRNAAPASVALVDAVAHRCAVTSQSRKEPPISFELWLLIIGSLLLMMALAHPVIARLPVTTTIVYLLLGLALGPLWLGVMRINPIRDTAWLLHASEVAVVISLFTVGMKLRLPIRDPQLRPALFLASVSMVLTIALVAAAGVAWLGLPLGAAVLLGGILAPTDPVLASDVQMRHPLDRDKLRLTLSVEAGLNDGTAFPFVILGLGLLAKGEPSAFGLHWLLVDGLWAISGGIMIGGAVGYGTGRLVLRLNAQREKPLAFGEYLVLGVIGVTYALAVLVHAYGFLAVFAAGVALRAAEQHASGHSKAADDAVSAIASGRVPALAPHDGRAAPAYFAGALLATNEQIERILEVGLVLIVGAMVAAVPFSAESLWFAALLFLVIRPLAVLPVRAIGRFNAFELGGIAWFGIRGIGSVYYLMYAMQAGLSPGLVERIASLVLSVIALSIFVHGISVTPLLNRYARQNGKRRS